MKPIEIPNHKGARQAMAARLAALGLIEPADVERRLLRGLKTLRQQPDREREWLRVKSGWPDVVQDAPDQAALNEQLSQPAPFRPTPFDVSDYLTALSWLGPLKPLWRRVIILRSHDFAWRDVGDRLCVTGETAGYHYRQGMAAAWIVAAAMLERECAGCEVGNLKAQKNAGCEVGKVD